MGTTGSNFSDNTSKYLGSVYTEYVREMDEPATKRGEEASDLALEMQHEFNMKLAETIQREQERDTPVYAEVRAEKKTKKGKKNESNQKGGLIQSKSCKSRKRKCKTKKTCVSEAGHQDSILSARSFAHFLPKVA